MRGDETVPFFNVVAERCKHVCMGRRSEELIAQSGALALVTNLVMAWNMPQMQATLDRWRAQGREIAPQILHHITPMAFEGINCGGGWSSPWSDTGHDCCRRVRHRRRR
jgi:Tn3 transposase DDE domain